MTPMEQSNCQTDNGNVLDGECKLNCVKLQ